jgi:hypothetical protein
MHKSHSWLFFFCAIEGAVALTALLLIPSEGGIFSPARLALLTILLALIAFWTYLGIRPPHSLDKLARPAFIVISVLPALTFSLLLFLLRYLDPERLLPAYERLSPLLWYLFVLSVQAAFFLLVLYKGFHPANLSSRRPLYISALIAFAILISVLILISVTRLGIKPDSAYWAEPGTPMLGWQFALALIVGVSVFCISFYVRAKPLDIVLPLFVYFAAVVIWLSVPLNVLQNSFYMPINPPVSQPFPYSDAGYYDQMAHSILIGHPYHNDVPTRPLYLSLLAILHLIFGEDYARIISGQTFLLALIPVTLYLLGKNLHSHATGMIVASFFIFRELTTLMISSDTRVSNTKTLLVDLPTLLLLLLACLAVFYWLKNRDKNSALISGGAFGLLLLLRTQSLLVLPFILLAVVLVLGWRGKIPYRLTALFFLGLIITIAPWLTHNYLLTGEFAFDATSQYKTIASQYAYSGNLDTTSYDFEGKSLGWVLVEFAVRDPAFVFGFIATHFLAAQVNGMLALPLFKPYNGISAPVNLYWMEWNGQLEWFNLALLIFYLAIIALGFGAAWRRWRWLGLLPLAFSIGYALATAVGRFSGWRYDLPADWIYYFYFGVGFAELIQLAAMAFGVENNAPKQPEAIADSKPNGIRLAGLALLFVFLGTLPWAIKYISPPRYADQSPDTLEAEIVSITNAPTLNEINAFTLQAGSFLQEGRLLYPRFFTRNSGLASTNPWPSYAIRDYPRLGFLLINQASISAVFPTRNALEPFPHASDAIILGCQREDHVEVRLIAFPDLDVLYLSAPLTDPCD